MAERSEALTQIARLLSDPSLRQADDASVRRALDERLDALVRGLVDEAAASDDVSDRDSAVAYLEARLAFLGPLLAEEQAPRLRQALLDAVSKW